MPTTLPKLSLSAAKKSSVEAAVATPVGKSAVKPAGKAVAKPAAKSVTAKTTVAKPTIKPPKSAVAAKPKAKLVRDSFTMPQEDFDLIDKLKTRALGFKRPTKKSELLRAGLQVLAGLSADALQQALERLTPLKSGRPKKAG